MLTSYETNHGTSEYDTQFETVAHFSLFPDMRPWVGTNYSKEDLKILVIGESHYFAEGTEFHHDVEGWYERKYHDDLINRQGHRVRYQISKLFDGNMGKSHVMYKRISKSLSETKFVKEKIEKKDPFQRIAYINYFQRPANSTGDSISPKTKDKEVAYEAINGVIEILKPSLVIFVSKKSFKSAKSSGLLNSVEGSKYVVAHPCSAWWGGRKSKEYGKIDGDDYGAISGNQRFIEIINRYC